MQHIRRPRLIRTRQKLFLEFRLFLLICSNFLLQGLQSRL